MVREISTILAITTEPAAAARVGVDMQMVGTATAPVAHAAMEARVIEEVFITQHVRID